MGAIGSLSVATPPLPDDASLSVTVCADDAAILERSPLRQTLDEAIEESGGSLKELTVLATQNDPLRVDTPARHRDGAWLAMSAQELGLGERQIHLRGLHYMLIGRPKPDGEPYTNTDADWLWLQSNAAKAARWLGYLPFAQITDQRNAAPIVENRRQAEPSVYLNPGLHIEIPDAEAIMPTIGVEGFLATQPYKLVFFGEKASLAEVLLPLAHEVHADTYLPTGEISDTLLYQMARSGSEDGRPMMVLCFSDCDPAGWQMPISIARKLQAFRALEFPTLDFQVRRVGLTPEQARAYELPSTPLRESERRADRWRTAMGVEQTEIDALASLRPALLREIASAAIAPFFDHTLERRVFVARSRWLAQAQALIDDRLGEEQLQRFREQAAEKLEEMKEQIAELNAAVKVSVSYAELPAFEIPDAVLSDAGQGKPLVDSAWPFVEQCRTLVAAKNYAGGE